MKYKPVGLLRPIDDEVFDLYFEDLNNNRPVLRVDLHKAEVKNLVDGSTLSFINAYEGYRDRNFEIVPSESNDEDEYLVTKVVPEDPRTWTCSCKDWMKRRNSWQETCKHIGFVVTGEYKKLRL